MGNGDFSLKEEKGSFVNERALIKEDKMEPCGGGYTVDLGVA